MLIGVECTLVCLPSVLERRKWDFDPPLKLPLPFTDTVKEQQSSGPAPLRLPLVPFITEDWICEAD